MNIFSLSYSPCIMKSLIVFIVAAGVLVGCGGPPKDIWEAAEQGDIEAVKEYLAIGTSVNAKDEAYGGMPLHWAAYRGRKEVAEFLINEGADVNAKNQADATPLDKAIEKNRDETAGLLRKHGGKTVEELEDEGNRTDQIAVVTQPEPQTAKTPDISIHEAASEGYPEVVKRLLAAGADVNVRDDAGRTLLHEASYAGHKEIVELLITKGADLNAKGLLDGATPLHFAAFRGHKEVFELLITKGADLNVRMNNGKLPLHMAVEMNHGQIADLIRKHGGKTKKELEAAGK